MVDAAVERAMAEADVPGLSLSLLGSDGQTVERTYGHADRAARRQVEPETLFEIGSIGKSFTAVAVLQLVEEGRIDLHAPVERYLGWFRVDGPSGDRQPITIHHLLTHSAGIVSGIDGTPEAAFQVWSLRDLPTAASPGSRFHYSNVGYKALGLVLEALEGRPYPEVIASRILDPLRMTATEPAITHDIRPRLAVGYEYQHDDRITYPGAPQVPATWLETGTADGSIASTAGDMAAFARMLLARGQGPAGRILSEASFVQMSAAHIRTSAEYAYGYGLATRVIAGRSYLGHGGGMVGYTSGLQLDPEAGLGAVVLQNGYGGNPVALARTLIAFVRDGRGSVATVTAPVPTKDDDRRSSELAGLYRPVDGGVETLEIANDKGRLVLRSQGREIAMEEQGEGLFLVPDPSFDRAFLRADRDPDGTVELWHGSRRYVRDGSSPRGLPELRPALRAYVARFRSHNPWTTNFEVIARGDRLWLLIPAAPDGFEEEQPLIELSEGLFRVGEDPFGPERVSFDTVVDGHALRARLSGWPYYQS